MKYFVLETPIKQDKLIDTKQVTQPSNATLKIKLPTDKE
jgi:hypothetical protein